MFQKIHADVEENDWAAAKEKLELLQNAWEEFYADSDQTERLGNILSEVNNTENNSKKEWKIIANDLYQTARLEFLYDSQEWRFSRRVYARSGANWVLSSEKKFIYDGFKQIAEYNGTMLAQA